LKLPALVLISYFKKLRISRDISLSLLVSLASMNASRPSRKSVCSMSKTVWGNFTTILSTALPDYEVQNTLTVTAPRSLSPLNWHRLFRKSHISPPFDCFIWPQIDPSHSFSASMTATRLNETSLHKVINILQRSSKVTLLPISRLNLAAPEAKTIRLCFWI